MFSLTCEHDLLCKLFVCWHFPYKLLIKSLIFIIKKKDPSQKCQPPSIAPHWTAPRAAAPQLEAARTHPRPSRPTGCAPPSPATRRWPTTPPPWPPLSRWEWGPSWAYRWGAWCSWSWWLSRLSAAARSAGLPRMRSFSRMSPSTTSTLSLLSPAMHTASRLMLTGRFRQGLNDCDSVYSVIWSEFKLGNYRCCHAICY